MAERENLKFAMFSIYSEVFKSFFRRRRMSRRRMS